MRKEIQAGNSANGIAKLAKRRFNEVESELKFFLDVTIYERNQCRSEVLRSINGVMFAMPDYMIEPLNSYSFDFDGENFVLRKGSEVAVNLRSIFLGGGIANLKRKSGTPII